LVTRVTPTVPPPGPYRSRMGAGVFLSRRNQFWIALIGLATAQVGASLFMHRGEALTIASDLIQGLLLLVATAAFLPKTARARSATFHARLFWILMSAGMVFWLAYQAMWNYFEVIKRVDVPDPFAGDVVLFLHLVPMIAALAVLPHLRGDERDERIRMLDFTLLLIWWVVIYVYMVIPWQTVQVDETRYSSNFNFAYLTEKTVLLAALLVLVYTAQGGWRRLYAHFLGASALYASSSYFANYAIGHKTYYSGSIYDIPLTVSVAWMAAIPAFATHYDLSDTKSSKPLLGVGITRLSMLALCTLPWAALHAELDATLPRSVRAFRIVISLGAAIVMGIMAFWRQRLLAAELTHFLDKSHRSFDDLKRVQQQLIHSEKLASLGQLVGGAAHEINNPLTAMLGYSDLLSASNLPVEEQKQAAAIGEQVRRTKGLVASLLTFARQAPAKLAAVDPNSLLQTAMRLLSPQLETQGILTRLELRPGLPPVLADSNQLLHVCRHLAGQIGGQFDRETHSALLIRTSQEGDAVVIEFLTGAPSMSRPVCDVLLTAEGANKPSTLSLSACSRIIEEHGGRLLRPSRPDVHAFRLELPIASRSGATPTRAAALGAY
jgi:signal transduction histidine kinase